ncbi:phage head morphogenesis protein [Micromonospora sp. MED01]|uniref:phage head morphogenesis protein n=1 Tax=Micromonospora alfalfae TaxID=2911212 RepID=UPI001EE88EFF|nr:phage head morphogenesis protein [Micromonospora alfalfae]MCG5464217.1 phage head morphogenesis protein [Micromonospora alfalfae]
MAVTSRTLQLIRAMRTAVGGYADDTVRDLAAQWVAAWDRLAPTWVQAVDVLVAWALAHGRWPTPVELARVEPLQQALAATDDALDELEAATTAAVIAAADLAITATVAAEPDVIASQLPSPYRQDTRERVASAILPTVLDVIRNRVTQQITVQTRPLSVDASAAIRRELVRGVELGSNPTDIARRAVAAVNGAFDGGLQRAANIARTEVLDAHRTAARYAHDANADLLDGWVWLATVTGASAVRTCPSCWAMHGTVHDLDEAGPLDHQQGRCARAPKTKPWRALGIDLDEPADQTPDRQAAFDALTDQQQAAVLGAARLALLRAARIDWSDLAVTRDNPAWRTSYVPRPLRDLNRIADQRR